MQRTHAPESGFTLLELMVVVTIVAVLAAVALPSFTSDARRAKGDSEVGAFFAELKIRQEQYAIENGTYLATGASEAALFPATPSAAAKPLGTLPTTWQALKVRPPESSARCGYVVIAGVSGDAAGTIASATFLYVPPAKNWFYILARCDLDNNSAVDSYYFISNDNAKIQKTNPGR